MEIINLTRKNVLADRAKIADGFMSRLVGLMGKKNFPPGSGLVIIPCNAVHSCFMRFNIDVIFVNGDLQVMHILKNLPPFKFSPIVKGAKMVIELPGGVIEKTGTSVGDIIKLIF